MNTAKKIIYIGLSLVIFSWCTGNAEKEIVTKTTENLETQEVSVSPLTGKYEDLPQQSKDEIKQMVDVIVLYIIKKGLPESPSWELTNEEKKAFFNSELIAWIDEEILPAYPYVDFSGMKKIILWEAE